MTAYRTLVRSDANGLFLRAGGYIARPGDVGGYSHAYNMSDGNLKAALLQQQMRNAQ